MWLRELLRERSANTALATFGLVVAITVRTAQIESRHTLRAQPVGSRRCTETIRAQQITTRVVCVEWNERLDHVEVLVEFGHRERLLRLHEAIERLNVAAVDTMCPIAVQGLHFVAPF